jgi:YHS domain-containing protein
MEVEEQRASAKAEHQGRTYVFCSEDCRSKFQREPERYARQSA